MDSSSESYACCCWYSALRLRSSDSMSTVRACTSSWSSSSSTSIFDDGRTARRVERAADDSCLPSGNLMFSSTYMLPLINGLFLKGIPSSSIHLNSPGWMTSPGAVLMRRTRLSRCVMVMLAPHSASRREISFFTNKSEPLRINTGCFSFCCATNTRSPGSIPGFSSALPANTIFSPSDIPLSTCTSSTSRSRMTLAPWHLVQRSESEMLSPVPWHLPQALCICWIMPGPIWRIVILTPWPWQSEQVTDIPLLEPVPEHFPQILLRPRAIFLVTPL
mmetsp:Transcript_5764/g.16194  ORF Transcript_5764/g.16194 Transcript_5764/m.16194 type:complete len:276 (+) Transcript_5764:262-1089(+)